MAKKKSKKIKKNSFTRNIPIEEYYRLGLLENPYERNLFTVGGLPDKIDVNLGNGRMASQGPISNQELGLKNTKAGGGKVGAPDVAGAITGTIDMVNAISDIGTMKDTSGYENQVNSIQNQTFNAGSTSDLKAQFANREVAEDIAFEDIAGTKKENRRTAGKAIGSGAAAGAAIGSMFGPWGCVCAGTRILINTGEYKNIEDLYQEEGIIGWGNNAAAKQKITLVPGYHYKECVRILLQSGTYLDCSTDHPILACTAGRQNRKIIKGKRLRIKDYKYIDAEKLHVGDKVAIAGEIDVWGNQTLNNAYLIGLLLGDGNYSKGHTVRLGTIDPSTWNYIETNGLGVLLPYENNFKEGRYSKEFRVYTITDGINILRNLGIYGQTKLNKRLPDTIHLYTKESIQQLIAGLFDADGCVCYKPNQRGSSRIMFSQSNYELLKQVREQLFKLGIFSSIRVDLPKIKIYKGHIINTKVNYKLIIKDIESLYRFYKQIPLNIDYKKEALEKIIKNNKSKVNKNYSSHHNLFCDRIEDIIPIGIQRIYNLEAIGFNNYIANFIVTHNTAIGAGVGALAGGVSAWVANNGKKAKARKKQQELLIQKRKAIQQQEANLQVAADNVQSTMADETMANYAAYGGLFNSYSDGGIHIKPSHRGRLTDLKARTGKTESELYNDGNPAHKKMVVFARNARKWHHADGGLFNRFAEGGDTEEEVFVNAPEDTWIETSMPIVEVAPKQYAPKPKVVEHTEKNKKLPNEATPENFLIGTNEKGEESQRYKIYKENLEPFLGREVSDEEAKEKLIEGVERMNATPASVIQYDSMFKMPWHATYTTDDKLSPYTVNREATKEADLGANGYFSSFNYEKVTNNKEDLVDGKYIKPGHIGYLEIEPGSPEWETLTAHERSHALMLKAAEAAIANRNIKPTSGEAHSYWDNAREIYARVKSMQVSEKMDSNKEYSAGEIRDILKNKKDKYNLDRYSDEDLEFIFNKVAYNNPSNLNIEVPEQMKYTNPTEGVSFAAEGGQLSRNIGPIFNEFSNGVTVINAGGTHSENPYEGIQVGVDPQGVPNLVEEGEVIWDDYVFSNRLKLPNSVRNKYKLRGNKNTSFADTAKEISKMSEEMPNDPIAQRTMELRLNDLMQEQEVIRMKKQEMNTRNIFSKGGKKFERTKKKAADRYGIDLSKYNESNYKTSDEYKNYQSANALRNNKIYSGAMQAVPIAGSLAAVINDMAGGNKPDFSNVEKYENAINKAYQPIEAKTLSNYLTYNPYDTSFELNKLGATQAASRNAILSSSSGNSAAARAAILASDYNYGNQIGDTYRRAQEYNAADRERVTNFNRATDQFNSQAEMEAARFNASQAAQKAEALGRAGQWREQITAANKAERSANLTGLLEGVAGLGETLYNQGQTKYLQDNKVLVNGAGTIGTNSKTNATTAAKAPVTVTATSDTPAYYTKTGPLYEDTEDNAYYTKKGLFKNGGKLKRKTKRRRLS